ncbi:MAG: hypothetical protein ACXIUW_06015 [Roseinatronobacter sp.]
MPRPSLRSFDLMRLPGAGQRKAPLQDQHILVLGQAYEFVCHDAVNQKAAQVVLLLDDTSESAPEAQILQNIDIRTGELSELGQDRFDVIFLPHAQSRANLGQFLATLTHYLRPKGVVILECSCNPSNAQQWSVVEDGISRRRYPSYGLLKGALFQDYAFRKVSGGVLPKRDGMTQMMFHLTPAQSTALIIAGHSGHGKSNLLRAFEPAYFPSLALDSFLSRMWKDKENPGSNINKRIAAEIGDKTADWGHVGMMIASDSVLTEEFCALISDSCPMEARVFIVEGELLRHEVIMDRLTAHLNARNVRVWAVTPRAL